MPGQMNDQNRQCLFATDPLSLCTADLLKIKILCSEQQSAVFICDFVSNKESGLNIHMAKKHAKIEQLEGNVENSESDEESDNYDIAKD